MARFLIGFGVLFGVLTGLSQLGSTGWWGLLVLAAMVPAALAVQWWLFGDPPAVALRRLGFGRPGLRALAVAVAVAALVQVAYPLTAVLSGAAPTLRERARSARRVRPRRRCGTLCAWSSLHARCGRWRSCTKRSCVFRRA